MSLRKCQLAAYLCSVGICLSPLISAYANPEGGSVAGGSATISQNGQKLDIIQKTDKAVINWKSFNLDKDDITQFHQPTSNSILLNRVQSNSSSFIDGKILANGNIVIVNSNGVFFGANSVVDVGSLTATTADIDNQSFMSGLYHFTTPGNPDAEIRNDGLISVKDSGLVSLVAPTVINNGLITAKLGKVNLASGETFTLDLAGDGVTNLAISKNSLTSRVINNGHIQADGGTITLSATAASDIVDSLITNTGVIEAKSLGANKGQIRLIASKAGTTASSGKSTVLNSGELRAEGRSAYETGGSITLLGDHIGLASGSEISVNGYSGGGIILIGGGFAGTGDLPHADMVVVQNGATLTANALNSGDGGQVVLWSDGTTDFMGTIDANALHNQHGRGGSVETSGKILNVGGSVNASSYNGAQGEWLLDPFNVVISSAANSNISNSGSNPITFTPTATATLSTTSIQNALNLGTNVVVNTNVAGAGNGDITVNNSIIKTAGSSATLTLSAYRNITFAAGVGVLSSSNALDLILNADNTGLGSGYVSLGNGSIFTNGGDIVIGGGTNPLSSSAVGNSGSVFGVYLNGTTLSASGGDITINGTGYSTTTNGNYGVYLNNSASVATTGSGIITINGQGKGITNSGSDCGVCINNGSQITSVDGNISITGTGGGAGTGATNYGVYITGAGSAVRTSGSGNISITGTGGNNTGSGSTNYGVFNASAGGIQTTGTGAITLTGNGSASTGGTNNGIIVTGSILGGGGNITLTGNGGASSLNSNRGVIVSAGTITNSGSGNITLNGTGNGITNSNGDNGIEVSSVSTISTTNGNIYLTGNAGGAGTGGSNYGVLINTAGTVVRSTGSGSIYITGTGGNFTGSGANNHGVYINAANAVTATLGDIVIDGTGGGGTGTTNYGVYVTGSIVNTAGNISVTGLGGNGSGGSNRGVVVSGATAAITTAGNGTMTVTGTGRGITNSASSYGVEITSGLLSTADGSLTVTGSGGGAGTGTNNFGVYVNTSPAIIKTTGTGSLFITGTGGNNTGTGSGNIGVNIVSTGGIQAAGTGHITLSGTGGASTGGSNYGVNFGVTSAAITASGGNISITGVGGNNSGNSNEGVRLGATTSIISTTGSGSISVTGTGKAVTSGGSSYGIDIAAGSIISSVDGNITLSGTGGGAGTGATNYGVYIAGAGSTVKTTGTGSISVTGAGGNTTGTGATNNGVFANVNNSIQALGSGNITISGTGGGFSSGGNNGVDIRTITANGGNISITGNGGNGSGTSNEGVRVSTSSTISTTGSGTISITGTGNGRTNSASDYGVELNTSAVQTVNGNITINGTGGGAGTGANNFGVYITGAGGTIKTTGAGNITVTGTGGNNSGSGASNYGVYSAVANGITTTGGGAITVTGQGGSSSGGSNSGVYITGSITGSGGAMVINGTGGNGSGNSNIGVYANSTGTSISNTGTGTVSITGIGRGSAAASSSERGVFLATSSVVSTVNGNLTVTGTGGGGASGTSNFGVQVSSGNKFTTTGSGNITINGLGGGGTTPYGISLGGANNIQTTGSGSISVLTDTISLGAANNINSISNLLIAPYTAGNTVGVGTGAGTLSLTNAYLGFLTWGASGILTIGNSSTGNMDLNTTTTFSKPVYFRTGSTGNIIVNGQLKSSMGSGTSFILASGKNFVNNVGSTAFSTGASRWLVYSTSPSSDTINSLTSSFRRFSCTYGGSCPSFPSTGNGFLYNTTPLLTVTPTTSIALTYGDAIPSLTGYAYALTGYLGSDSASDTVTGSLDGATLYTQGADIGSYNVDYASGTLASAMGYGFTYANNASAITVSPKTITASLTGSVSKVYDTATTATLASSNYSLSGLYGMDAVTVGTTSGTYDTKDVGSGKTVTVTGMTLSGAKAGNYVLPSTTAAGTIGDITPATLTITGVTANNKVYDATTAATLNSTLAALSGVLGSDTVTLGSGAASGTFLTASVGSNKPVTASGYTIGGADAGNYVLSQPTGLTANITPASGGGSNSADTALSSIPPTVLFEFEGLNSDRLFGPRGSDLGTSGETLLYRDSRGPFDSNGHIYYFDPRIGFTPSLLDLLGIEAETIADHSLTRRDECLASAEDQSICTR